MLLVAYVNRSFSEGPRGDFWSEVVVSFKLLRPLVRKQGVLITVKLEGTFTFLFIIVRYEFN